MIHTRKHKEAPITAARRKGVERLYRELSDRNLSRKELTAEMLPHFEFFVQYLCKRFFLPGAETEDLAQEARSGLSHAGETYKPEQGTSYYDYTTMCMRNSVLAAVRKATREKQKVLSEASSLDAIHTHPAYGITPDRVVASKLLMEGLFRWMDREMSKLEANTLRHWLQGTGVSELSERWRLDAKKIENALFRARKKAKDFLKASEPLALAV